MSSACESLLHYDVKRNYFISSFQALYGSSGTIRHGAANPSDCGAAVALLVCPHHKSTLSISAWLCKSDLLIDDNCFYASLSVCTRMLSQLYTVYLSVRSRQLSGQDSSVCQICLLYYIFISQIYNLPNMYIAACFFSFMNKM